MVAELEMVAAECLLSSEEKRSIEEAGGSEVDSGRLETVEAGSEEDRKRAANETACDDRVDTEDTEGETVEIIESSEGGEIVQEDDCRMEAVVRAFQGQGRELSEAELCAREYLGAQKLKERLEVAMAKLIPGGGVEESKEGEEDKESELMSPPRIKGRPTAVLEVEEVERAHVEDRQDAVMEERVE